MREHSSEVAINLFNSLFQHSYQTILVRGESAPLYRPAARPEEYHQVIFAHGFFSSALHEIAHWCIAGSERRKLEDYGYWYEPDGRSAERQKIFEQVEVKPQAQEWLFSVAAGIKFHFSPDNIAGGGAVDESFRKAVLVQVHRYLSEGLPVRAQMFAMRLQSFFDTGGVWQNPESYILDDW